LIIPIVEGFSEVEAVPELLRRLLYEDQIWDVQIAKPFRVKRTRVAKPGEIERTVELAVRSRPGACAVVVILDADDDDAEALENELRARAETATELPVAVVLARREYECWLLGGKESLRGHRGIREDATAPPNPEAIRGGKERLSANMDGNRGYVEVEDQVALTSQVDLNQAAAACPSFAVLRETVRRIAAEVRAKAEGR
jgi:hypothetical protein